MELGSSGSDGSCSRISEERGSRGGLNSGRVGK